MENVSCKVESLGYPPLEPVASFRSIAHLFGTSKSRCGIYLLEFPGSVFYIGKAIDVVNRFSQHRRKHKNILGFSFIKCPKLKLDEVEMKLIFDAENLGFILSNTVHATNVIGETDLDFVVSQPEQERWLKNPVKENTADKSSAIKLPESIVHRTRGKYIKFSEHAKSDVVIDLLRTYTNCCMPMPRRTEHSFWSLSCMPSTDSGTWPRMAVVNMSVMETFVIGYQKQSTDELWGYVNVASDILTQHWGWKVRAYISRFVPFSKIKNSKYRDAGQNQLSIFVFGAENLRKLLDDKSVQNAAAHLNLRLMRKRPTIYSKFHCSDLARQCVL